MLQFTNWSLFVHYLAKYTMRLSVVVFYITTSNAQTTDTWTLYGEGKNNEVRLLWSAPQWPDSLKGMSIQRRINGGAWQTLTSSYIYPSISLTKSLNNVSNDPAFVKSLVEKRSKEAAVLNQMDSASFMQFISNRGGLAMFSYSIAKDYDRALIAGFGFVDKKLVAPAGAKVEYTLLGERKYTSEAVPLASFTFISGSIPSYPIIATSSVKGNKTKNKIEVEWKVNTASYTKQVILQGFHIDRVSSDGLSRVRLTKKVIWPNTSGESFPIFCKDSANAQRAYTYELIPVSIFGIESKPLTVKYDPALVPAVFNVQANTTYKDGELPFTMQWTIAPENLKYIESYTIEEKKSLILYNPVKDSIKGTTYTFQFDSTRAYPKTYTYRVRCNLKNGYDPIYSNDVEINYAPLYIPAKTLDVKAVLEKEGSMNYAVLTWSPVPYASGYTIYVQELGGTRMIREASIPLIKSTTYRYPLSYPVSSGYVFAIAAVNERANVYGELSDKVTVTTPSEQLLRVYFASIAQTTDKKITLTWTYKEPADIIGYRLYENGELIADEKTLNKGIKSWTSLVKKSGRYEYTIQAVTASGIVSDKAFPKQIVIK